MSDTNIPKRHDFPAQKPDQGHNENEEPILPPHQTNRKSMLANRNKNNNKKKSKNKMSQNNEWTVQFTEDGEGQYLFNPTTGEMRFTFPEEDDDDDEDDNDNGDDDSNGNHHGMDDDNSSFRDASDRSWLHEYEEDEGGPRTMEEEEIEFIPQKIPLPWNKYIIPPDHYHLFIVESSQTITTEADPSSPLPPLTWDILNTCTAITIHNLNAAIQYSRRKLYLPYAMAVVNAIKLMMIACGAVDKEWFKTIQQKDLQSSHRSTIACLAKMMLTAVSAERGDVDKQHLINDAREVLVAVRSFVTACQANPALVRLRSALEAVLDTSPSPSIISSYPVNNATSRATSPPTPTAITTILEEGAVAASFSNSSDPMIPPLSPQYREHRENSTSSHFSARTTTTRATSMHSSSGGSNSSSGSSTSQAPVTPDECFDNTNSYDTIQSYITELEGAVDGMLTILNQHRHQREAMATLLLTRLDHMCQRTGQLLFVVERIVYSDQEIEKQIADCKPKLLHGFGVLFVKLQTMTSVHIPMDDAVLDVEMVVERIKKPMDQIIKCSNSIISHAKRSNSQRGSLILPAEDLLGDNKHGGSTNVNDALNNTQKLYMGYDYKPEEIVFSLDGQIKGGTLSALVERLTLHDQSDTKFIQSFLLTYRAFCSSEELFTLLKARFELQPPVGLTPEELLDWQENKQKFIRLRVFNVFKHWIEHYMNVEEDQAVLHDLLDFSNTTMRSSNIFSSNQINRLIRRRLDSDPLRKLVVSTPRDQPTPILPRNVKKFRLLDVHPLELARQLTIMDFGLYRSIQPSECLDKAWSSSDKSKGIHIRQSIEYNNQVTLWVSDSILCQNDIKKRSNTVKYWIQVAEKCCHQLHSFNTCMAILSAFESSAIARLHRTWEILGSRAQQTLNTMRETFASNRNFAKYRALVHSVNPPCIPFLGVYLQDLTFMEDGNPNVLKNTDLINFGKLAKTSEVIREIQQYQSTPYPFLSVSMLQMFIKANLQSARDEDSLYNESVKIEPKERTDEKVTRLLEESGFI
ncbi:ras guanine nucleotide exchange factor domain-containing protein [Phascolomyces articulosus]|uniref:Ras guanine nucleotide exchange factor domain-containing protein n=1 Tax=Phascolomyces articulosus TaxID=60185 RepID=A0AAD5JKR2_9FUNG|nr:ras guanine nucleotide exchange factor domain-containing protein [Phascolomyces articulosus]